MFLLYLLHPFLLLMAFNLDSLLEAIGTASGPAQQPPSKEQAIAELEKEVLAPVTDLSSDLWRWQV